MNETSRQNQSHEDISLVDLAVTFIRRRWAFYLSFGAIVALGLIYAVFMVGEVKEYSTLVQLGKQGEEALESPTANIAIVENRWYPELSTVYAENEGERLPFRINVSNPKDTLLLKLTSRTSPKGAEDVANIHQQLVDKIIQRQSDLLARSKSVLEKRLASVNETLKQLAEREVAGEVIARTIQERVELEARLQSLQSAEVLVVARESLEGKGTSKKLIIVLAVFLGLVFGVFAAYMAEFASKVRKTIKNGPNGK